jgi:hypothetical protein
MAKARKVKSMRRRRIERLFGSVPAGFVFTILVLVISVDTFVAGKAPGFDLQWYAKLPIVLVFVVALAVIYYQTRLNYQQKTHDLTWALKFQDKFEEMGAQRFKAAWLLKNKRELLSEPKKNRRILGDIDDVLDLFEDVGFYLQGEYISPEVAYQHFYHWVRGYYQSAKEYIAGWQDEEEARWENLDSLYTTLDELESGPEKRIEEEQFNETERDEFLEEEMSSGRRLLKLKADPQGLIKDVDAQL